MNLPVNNWELSTSGKMEPSWIGEFSTPLKFQKLEEDINADTIIVGGGIAGMTTAYLLSMSGNKVVLLEDGYIGSGETSRTLKTVGISNAKIIEESPLSDTDISPCIQFPNQAQFQPLVYLQGLSSAMTSKFEAKIFTETHADEVVPASAGNDDTVKVKTQNGSTVSAENVVLATNAPIVDKKSKIYDKQQPMRTYAIAIKVPRGAIPRALYWDTGNQKSEEKVKPYHYIRTQRIPNDDSNELIIVGGEDHKVGEIDKLMSEFSHFDNLYSWMAEKFSIKGIIAYDWSGQVLEPLDGLAFIGRNPGKVENIYIATGDSGNGITHGTVAGMIISDLILKGENQWANVYDPSRKIRRNSKNSLRVTDRKRSKRR